MLQTHKDKENRIWKMAPGDGWWEEKALTDLRKRNTNYMQRKRSVSHQDVGNWEVSMTWTSNYIQMAWMKWKKWPLLLSHILKSQAKILSQSHMRWMVHSLVKPNHRFSIFRETRLARVEDRWLIKSGFDKGEIPSLHALHSPTL